MTALGACHKQLNSSVGEFGTATLQAATAGTESNSPGDATYLRTDQALAALDRAGTGWPGSTPPSPVVTELRCTVYGACPGPACGPGAGLEG